MCLIIIRKYCPGKLRYVFHHNNNMIDHPLKDKYKIGYIFYTVEGLVMEMTIFNYYFRYFPLISSKLVTQLSKTKFQRFSGHCA